MLPVNVLHKESSTDLPAEKDEFPYISGRVLRCIDVAHNACARPCAAYSTTGHSENAYPRQWPDLLRRDWSGYFHYLGIFLGHALCGLPTDLKRALVLFGYFGIPLTIEPGTALEIGLR